MPRSTAFGHVVDRQSRHGRRCQRLHLDACLAVELGDRAHPQVRQGLVGLDLDIHLVRRQRDDTAGSGWRSALAAMKPLIRAIP